MTLPRHTLPVSEIVAWCPECAMWMEGDKPGELCPGEHETRNGSRKTVRRRGWVCREQLYCYEVFFSKTNFYEHSCGDAY